MNCSNAALLIFHLCAACLLASCSSFYDPAYLQLEPAAETNPKTDAIVGMWHRKGATSSRRETISLLFKPSGEGHYDSLMTDLLLHSDASGRFTWAYQGSGVWTTALLKAGDKSKGFGAYLSAPTSWRLSGTHLLQHTTHPNGTYFYVWEKVRQ